MMGKVLMTHNSKIIIEQNIFSPHGFNNPFNVRVLLIVALTFTTIFVALKELNII